MFINVRKIQDWLRVAMSKAAKHLPDIATTWGPQALHLANTIKNALASPSAQAIEGALEQLIPGKWEPAVIGAVTKGLSVAIPGITNVIAHGSLPVAEQGKALVLYLQGLSPKMQNAGLLKLLSGVFQALDPSMTELEADTAAQVTYAHSVSQNTPTQ